MRHGSLFSGIGAAEIAAEMLGWENVFHCEINPFGKQILDFWFGDKNSFEDVTKTDFKKFRGQIDILTGGFPCQPFSYAGSRGGAKDERYLWPEMLRVIDEIRPTWVVGENVAGITTMVESDTITNLGCESSLFEEDNGVYRYQDEQSFTIERICHDLESKGYSVQPMLIPAAAVGAPHRRDRVFIIAYNVADTNNDSEVRESGGYERKGKEKGLCQRNKIQFPGESNHVRSELSESTPNTECLRLQHDMVGGSETRMSKTQTGRGEKCLSEQIQFTATDGEGEYTSDSISAGLERQDKSRSCKGEEWMHIRRNLAGCSSKISADTNSDRVRQGNKHMESELAKWQKPISDGGFWYAPNSESKCCDGLGTNRKYSESQQGEFRGTYSERFDKHLPFQRWERFPTVSAVHRGNDGIPFDVDCLSISFPKWRNESLKAYGNAIVPQVLYQIFSVIDKISKK